MNKIDHQAKRQLKATYAAPALEKGFKVVEVLAGRPAGLTVTEIAAGLGLSPSEIFRIVVVMEQNRWLKKSDGDKYTVTPKVLALAFRATSAEDLSSLAIPHMREFCQHTDQSCHLVVRDRDKGLVIARFQNPGPIGIHIRIGAEVDLMTSSSGHILQAFDLASALKGEASIQNPLDAQLNAVRQRGYERLESTLMLGVTDISYPIFDIYGMLAAAITVPFIRRINGLSLLSLEETQDFLGQTARKISQELAARPRAEHSS